MSLVKKFYEKKELRDLEIELRDLKNELEFLRKNLDYRNVKSCKNQLDEVLKKYFGDI